MGGRLFNHNLELRSSSFMLGNASKRSFRSLNHDLELRSSSFTLRNASLLSFRSLNHDLVPVMYIDAFLRGLALQPLAVEGVPGVVVVFEF